MASKKNRLTTSFVSTVLWIGLTTSMAQEVQETPKNADDASAAIQKGEELLNAGQYAAVVPLAKRAIATNTTALGPVHPETLRAKGLLGRAYIFSGELAKAEPIVKETLAERERVFGPIHAETANGLASLGILYRNMGRYDEAEPLLVRCLEVRKQVFGVEHRETAIAMNALAFLYIRRGSFDKAQSLLLQALSIREKILGTEHTDTLNTYNMLGGLNFELGAYSTAEMYWRRTLELREKVLPAGHPDIGLSVNNLAVLFNAVGDYPEAESMYLRSLRIREATIGMNHPDAIDLLSNLGKVTRQTGAFDRSEAYLRRALEAFERTVGPDHPQTAMTLNEIGALYANAGNFAMARPPIERALAIYERKLGNVHPNVGQTLSLLAYTSFRLGDVANAESLYKRAIDIFTESFGTFHPDLGEAASQLAELYLLTGRNDSARRYYEVASASDEHTFGAEHPSSATATLGLGLVHWANGRHADALDFFQRAGRTHGRNIDRFMVSGSDARKRAFLRTMSTSVSKYISFSVSTKDNRAVEVGLNGVLQLKGRALDAVSGTLQKLRRSESAQNSRLLGQLADLANQLSTVVYSSSEDKTAKDYRARLASLMERQESLENQLASHSRELRRELRVPSISNLRRLIPSDAALVEFYLYDHWSPRNATSALNKPQARYVAYVLTKDADPVALDLGDAKSIDTLVTTFRAALVEADQTIESSVHSGLFEVVAKPVIAAAKNKKHLIVSPDGLLNLVPLGALLDGNRKYLTERFEITYITSGRDLERLDGPEVAGKESIVFANPDFGTDTRVGTPTNNPRHSTRSAELDRGGMSFRPLPNTAREAEELGKLLRLTPTQMFLGASATEDSIKQLMGPRILHISTHGFFLADQGTATRRLEERPANFDIAFGEDPLLRSGLALSGANARRSGNENDGILTASEVARLNLQGTELVVLSACDTGTGQIENGEGVYGLRRALVLAGAQSQVATLWKVDDEAALILTIEYYRRLLAGEGRSSALRHTQLRMLAHPIYSHPYYWASFVPYGSWTPLSFTTQSN